MSSFTSRYLIAVALSYGANIVLFEAELAEADAKRIKHLLSGLADLGHVASFTIDRPHAPMDEAAILDAFRHRWDFVVDAVLATDQTHRHPLPAYLMPVWPFDHEWEGRPASTARFLHLDLEVIANPTADEEIGVSLPGRTGCWVVHARPILF
jgi:hypothetical protein